MILVSVIDSGPGIAQEVAARLFEHFVTNKQRGNGRVGLSISRTIIETHGGRIWFESNPDGGTIFRFTLRAVAAEEIEDAG
jgi:two-component system, LuxR family, sensor kinase FixL